MTVAGCIPESNQISPVVNPDLQVRSELDSGKLKLTLIWNDLGKYYRDITYTVVVRKTFLVNQFDTLALNQKLNTLDGIAVVPNTTVDGTVYARTGQGQVFKDEFSLKVGAPAVPNDRYVALQDIAFERYLVDAKIDSDKTLNGLILKADIQQVDTLNLRKVPSLGIDYFPTNLKGIEYFTGLTHLTINTAFVDSLDLSQNKALVFLDCQGYNVPGFYQAKLAYLQLGSKPRLTQLLCGSSELTTLDLTGCPLLKTLSCSTSYLKVLQSTACPELEYINVSSNNLVLLDVTANVNLRFLDCSGARSLQGLASLDVSKNPELRELHCQSQRINTPLSLCSNKKLVVCRTDQTPIPTIQVPFPVDETLLQRWSKDAKTAFTSCL